MIFACRDICTQERLIKAWVLIRMLLCRFLRSSQKPQNAALLGLIFISTFGLAAFSWILPRRRVSKEVEIDAIFVTDCSDYQEWLSQAFLLQWRRAGFHKHTTLTRIVACDEGPARDALLNRMSRADDPHQPDDVFVLPELNVAAGERYLCGNRPRGLRRWLDERPPRGHDHWVALLDPDMLMLRPFDGMDAVWHVTGAAAGKDERASWRLRDVPPGVALSHHFTFLPEQFKQLDFSLSKLCSPPVPELERCEERLGDLFADPELLRKFYSVGVPHIIRAEDLQRMAPAWMVLTDRVRSQYKGWTAEMYSWLLAAHFSQIRFVYLSEVISDPGTDEPAWAAVDEGTMTCGQTDVPRQFLSQKGLSPWILHFCEVYNVTYNSATAGESQKLRALHLDKRSISRVLREHGKGLVPPKNFSSLLDCQAPLLETAVPDLLQRRPTGRKAAPEILYKRSSWFLCVTLQAINDGLMEFKRHHCPVGFNQQALLRPLPKAAQVAEMLLSSGLSLLLSRRRRPVDSYTRFNSSGASR